MLNAMKIPMWNIEALTGYKPQTSFWMDFSIADKFGAAAVQDTYNRSFAEWKSNVVFLTELVMVLNWKIWQYYKSDNKLAELYDYLWREADEYCCNNLQGEDAAYYYRTTD